MHTVRNLTLDMFHTSGDTKKAKVVISQKKKILLKRNGRYQWRTYDKVIAKSENTAIGPPGSQTIFEFMGKVCLEQDQQYCVDIIFENAKVHSIPFNL